MSWLTLIFAFSTSAALALTNASASSSCFIALSTSVVGTIFAAELFATFARVAIDAADAAFAATSSSSAARDISTSAATRRARARARAAVAAASRAVRASWLHRRSFLPRTTACRRVAASARSAPACLRAARSSAVSFGSTRARLGPCPAACTRSDSMEASCSRALAANSCRT